MATSNLPNKFIITDIKTLDQIKKLVYVFSTTNRSMYVERFRVILTSVDGFNPDKFCVLVEDGWLRGYESLKYFKASDHYKNYSRLTANEILHTPVKLTRLKEER
jgi:hypothetical protein